jgi:hypothetical protein
VRSHQRTGLAARVEQFVSAVGIRATDGGPFLAVGLEEYVDFLNGPAVNRNAASYGG